MAGNKLRGVYVIAIRSLGEAKHPGLLHGMLSDINTLVNNEGKY